MTEYKCGLYIRVSTLRQACVEDGSLKAQEAKLRAYVDYENKNPSTSTPSWKVVDVYREEGKSAKDLKRPEFQRMMSDVESGKINTIIVWKIDRLTRSLRDFSNLWEIFQQKKVNLISLCDKFDTNTAIGRAMLSIVLIFAQLEREQTGERTQTVMQYRAEKGLWNGGRVLGYDLDSDNKGMLKINTEQAKLIKKAFDLCIEKGSAGQVQRILNELGYRMPLYESRRGKKHGDTLFTKQAVVRLLSNPAYVGKITWAGKVYNGNHKPIIDQRTFAAVQKIIEKNRVTRSNEKAPKQHVYLLAGILRCAKCGSMMTLKSGKNGSGQPYHYYQCTKNSHIGKSACRAKYVPAKSVEDFVIERLKELSTKKEEIDKMVEKASRAGNLKLASLNEEKMRLETTLAQLKVKINNIVDAVEAGQGFKPFAERAKKLETEQESIESKLQEKNFEIQKVGQEILNADVMKQNFEELKDIIENAKAQRLKDLFYKIIEVIEWHESDNDQTQGHIKISYFEQSNITIPSQETDPKNTKSEQHNKALFAQSMNWLPALAEGCPIHRHLSTTLPAP